MSSNLLSPQFSSMEMGQLEPILNDGDSSIPGIQMGGMNSVSSNPESQQIFVSSKQMELMLEPMPGNIGSQGLSMTYLQMGDIANANGDLHKLLTPSNQQGEIGSFPKNVGSDQLMASIKRKAPFDPMSHNQAMHQLSMPNKRMAHMEHRPWLQQAAAANRRAVQLESVQGSPGSPHFPVPNKKMARMDVESVHSAPASPHLPSPNKKMVKMESFSGRSGSQRSSCQKNPVPQIQPSSKVKKESFESVRSKMKESLAAALALVNQQQDKCVDSGKKSQGEVGGIQVKTEENPQPALGPTKLESKEPVENFSSSETCSIRKSNDGEGAGQGIVADATTSASTLTSICDVKEFPSSNILLDEDVSFSDNLFVKDELLQGNGLSWVLESEMEMADSKEIQFAEKQKLADEEMGHPEEQPVQSPEELAFRIEEELFKLFGGVNKKYKEKGRSLLFNLKDRNNPELREKVMSGVIPPERLCTMTAEELASKELSEWRIAKAEEMAQMVVLPDSEVDIRRLVKKTHKGEVHVEVEQYDNATVDSVDATSHTQSQSQSRSKEREASTPLKPDKTKDELKAPGEKSNTEDKTTECTFTIPSTEATDLMQGLMVDDGLKDLPPIVSLDEFMESLDTEPPFEILPEKVIPISDKDDSEAGSELKSSVLSPKNAVDVSPPKHDETGTTDSKPDAHLKSSGGRAVIKTSDGTDSKSRDICADLKDVKSNSSPKKSVSRLLRAPKGEHLWGGSLQLSLSTMASVVGIYKSGEKTSTKEWPGILEIKGRVRLDAFEKFLQELPQSRSRAVMVLHFVPKEWSSEAEFARLREVGESYVVDERVGFAEFSGVEIYFCPPHNKTFDILNSKIIPKKEHIEAVNSIDNGLIAVVVWRKLTSPKSSSSHHKHVSKKQQYTTTTTTSRRHQDTKLNTNITSKPSHPRTLPPTHTQPAHDHDDDDEDDVPPGFGPGASRDEDDLPEFSFTGGSNQFSTQTPSRGPATAPPPLFPKSQMSSRPVENLRELIHKYGQNNSSTFQDSGRVAVQPWNDDDDDIPEWQPTVPPQPQSQYLRPQQGAVNNLQQQPMLRPHLANQSHMGLVQHQQHSLQPTVNVAPNLQNPNPSWQQGSRWATPAQGGSGGSGGNGMYANNLGCQPEAGQFYVEPDRGTAAQTWRQNAPKSRGF